LAATRQSDLVKSDQPKRVGGLTPEQMTRMEREMETVQQDLKSVESRYGDDVLHLVIACGYVSKMVKNREIKRYLTQHHRRRRLTAQKRHGLLDFSQAVAAFDGVTQDGLRAEGGIVKLFAPCDERR
jgi:hypothetical protein